MTKARPVDLIYGHVGEPTYDSESQAWHFPRQLSVGRHIQPIGSLHVVDGPSRVQGRLHQDAVNRQPCHRSLVNRYPELKPAHGVSGDAEILAAFPQSPPDHDPTQQCLITSGYVIRRTGLRHNDRIPILATVAGVAGELLKLKLLRKERLEWEDNEIDCVDHLTAKGGQHGWWRGNGSAIEQVCSSRDVAGKDGMFLAVRYGGLISILQPLLQPQLTSSLFSGATRFHLPSSQLDPHEVVQIKAQNAITSPFADVCFNPWDSQQVATIDREGNWSIWDFEIVSNRRNLWAANEIASDSLQTASAGFISPDGWAKVLWVCDFRTLLFVGRRTLSLAVLKSKVGQLHVPDLALANLGDWILDVCHSSRDDNQIFLMTSTRLFWLNVEFTPGGSTSEEVSIRVTSLLSWVHFRDPQDLSLRLHLPTTDNAKAEIGQFNVMLYSQINVLVSVFTFEYLTTPKRATSVNDPYVLSFLHDNSANSVEAKSQLTLPHPLSGIILRPTASCDSCDSREESASESASQDQDEGYQFYDLTLLFQDFTLLEGVYVRPPRRVSVELKRPNVRVIADLPKTPSRIGNEFVVPDDLDYEEHLGDLADTDLPEHSPHRLPSLAFADDPRTLEFQWLEHQILDSRDGRNERSVKSTLSAEDAFSAIEKAAFNDGNSGVAYLNTLFELADVEIIVGDIDEVDTSLHLLVDRIIRAREGDADDLEADHYEADTAETQLALPWTFLREFSSNSGPRMIYDVLVQSCLAPLSKKVSGRARVTLDRNLRSIAVQLCLASRLSRTPCPSGSTKETGLRSNADPQLPMMFELPMRKKASASSVSNATHKGQTAQTSSNSPFLASSQQLDEDSTRPTSSGRSIPFDRPSTSARSQASASTEAKAEDPASERVRSLVKSTPCPTLPPDLSSVLYHWTVGTDHANYDWVATTQALERDTEVEDEHSESRKPKRKKRLRERISDWSAEQPLRKRVVTGSQPLPASQPAQVASSSQNVVTQDSGGGVPAVTASQPTAGAGGGRNVRVGTSKLGMKKKKRKEGF